MEIVFEKDAKGVVSKIRYAGTKARRVTPRMMW